MPRAERPLATGKSSLLRAGLVPRWAGPVVVFTPGPHPVEEAAVHLARLAGLAPGQVHTDLLADVHNLHRAVRMAVDEDLLIIVDQFEEVFTLCRDEAERDRFIDLLLAAVHSPNSRTRVALGVRADFYGHCTRHAGLVEAMTDAQVAVGPMTAEELRRAIVQPAVKEECVVEGTLLVELVTQAAGNAGALPLLSHALLETWRRRRGNTLTLAAFQAAGGINGALARTAETVYADLDEPRRKLVRNLFLRLTAFGEGTEDTKRRITRAELDADTTDVLDVLAEARLVTVADNTVEIAHEALIRAWPRLRQWLAADREGLRTHRHLTEAAQEWSALDQDPGALYRGARLAVAKEWAGTEHAVLNPVEQAFLGASVEQGERESARDRRRARQLRYLAAGLAVLLVVVTAISVVAVRQREQAEQAQGVAISRQLATQALTIAESDPGRAKLLGLEAYRTAPTLEARSALMSMSAHREYRTEIQAQTGALSDLAYRPDGTLVSAGREKTVALWDPARRTRLAALTGHDTWIKALAVSKDGKTAATGGDDKRVVLWDLDQRRLVGSLEGHGEEIRKIAFSPDGRLVASASNDRTVRLWDVGSQTNLATFTGHRTGVATVAISPDGRTLVTGGDDQTIVLWDIATRTRLATLAENVGEVRAFDFSPDGTMLATAGVGPAVRVWDLASRSERITFTGHSGEAVITVRFSPDGRTIASAGNDLRVMLWDVPNGVQRGVFTGHQANIYTLAFSPDGAELASAGEEGKIMLWDPRASAMTQRPVYDLGFTQDGRGLITSGPGHTMRWDVTTRAPERIVRTDVTMNAVEISPDGRTFVTGTEDLGYHVEVRDLTSAAPAALLPGHTAGIMDVALSPDGRTAASTGKDMTLSLWDLPSRTRSATLDLGGIVASGVAFSPDGHLLAVATHADNLVTLWDPASRTRKAQLRGHTGWVRSVAFSPDGRLLASAAADQTVILWDVATGAQITRLTGHKDAFFHGLAFSPDGRTIAYTSADNTVLLWDVAQRQVSARLTGHATAIRALAFSPDSTTLATAGADGTVILWDMDPARVAGRICDTLSRNLTEEEWAQFVPGVSRHDPCAGR